MLLTVEEIDNIAEVTGEREGAHTFAVALETKLLEKLCAGVEMPEAVNNDLADDISAIDAMYRGDPSYEHDAYYMRSAAEKCVRKGYALYTADQLRAYGAAQRAKALEDAEKKCEAISDEYHKREGMKYPELKTDAETGASDCEMAIRALKGEA